MQELQLAYRVADFEKHYSALPMKNVIWCCGEQQEHRLAGGILLVKQMPPSS